LAGALLFNEKIRLLYFGLDWGILEFFTSRNPTTTDVSPAFLEHGSAEKIVV
jgi:hypothetical protein